MKIFDAIFGKPKKKLSEKLLEPIKDEVFNAEEEFLRLKTVVFSQIRDKSLEQAKDEGLITEEEFLRLKSERADEELKLFLKEKKKK